MDPFELIGYLIIGFIGMLFVLWAYWSWKTYKKKKNGLLTFQLIVFFGTLFWITWSMRIFPGSQAFYDRQYNKELTGKAFSTYLTFSHESPRAFNGDGYSIWVYEFDQETAQLFSPPDNEFFSNFPIRPDYRSHWQQKKWDKTPLNQDEQKFLDFALSEFTPDDTDKAKKIQDTFDYIEKIMNEPGHYYAYNYYMHSNDYIGDIDFFIISPTDKKLIVINHNT